jgi:uncharacterized protein involved in exopolysaccharide biosynthesis
MVTVAAFTFAFAFHIVSRRVSQLENMAQQDFVRANIAALEVSRQQLLSSYGPTHPKIRAATTQLDALKRDYETTFTPSD